MNPPPSPPKNAVRFQWAINWKLCVFALCFLPILTGLGFWQLQRAEHKRTLAQTFAAGQAGEPVHFAQVKINSESQSQPGTYQKVRITGRFEQTRYWLKDNAIWQGRAGFDVITPFFSDTGEVILVNRGWVAGTGNRDLLPGAIAPAQPLTIVGTLVKPSENPLLKNPPVNTHSPWPRLVIAADPQSFGEQIDQPLWPQIVHIAAESPGALQTHWQPLRMTAERHKGYAVQWFSMAGFLLLLTLFANSNFTLWIKAKLQ